MAMKLSQSDLRKAAERAQSLSTRLAGIKRRTERVTERAVHSTEIAAAAFAAGVIQGKTGGIEIVGVPLELGLGLALNLGGYLGLAGNKMSEHLHGFGDGFLAAYLTTLGRGVGQKMVGAAAATDGGGSGLLENASVRRVGVGSAGFTDAELARTVAAAAAAPVRDEE
jgi:hypothetical protein